MSLVFWMEIVAFGTYLVGSAALALVVLGTGAERTLNRFFGLFTLSGAIWAVSALMVRLTLAMGVGNPAFWLELASVVLNAMGPFLLLFAVRYVDRPTRWADITGILGLVLFAGSSVFVFQHRLVYEPFLGEQGLVSYQVVGLGYVLPQVAVICFLWSAVLFWRERHRTGEPYLALSALMLVVGFILGGVFRQYLPYPILSVTVTVSIALLFYGVFARQLFNPMKELTENLELRVEERSGELAEALAGLEAANVVLARRTGQFAAAAQVAREAAAIRDVGHLLGQTVRLVSERFGFYHAGIFLLDERGEYAVLRAASSDGGQRMLGRGHKLRVGQVGIVGRVAESGQSRVVLDVGEDAVYFDNPDLPSTRSEMALPLKVRERVIGVLDVQSVEPEAFSDEDVSIVQTLADQVALALENARLLVEAQDRLRETNILLGRERREGWGQMAVRRPGWGYTYDGVEVLSGVQDRGAETESLVSVPLQVRGEEIGQVELALPGRSATPEERAMAEAIVEQASLALESSRLFQETQRALGETDILYRVSASISEAQTFDQVLEALRQHTLLGRGDRCAIARFDKPWVGDQVPDWAEIVSLWDSLPEPRFSAGVQFNLALFPALRQIAPDAPVIIPDVENDRRLDEPTRLAYLQGLRARGVLLVPLLIVGGTFGWLVALHDQPTRFPQDELRLLLSLAGQAAVATQSILLLEQTRSRVERERLISDITAKVRSTTEVDTILRTTIRELGRALHVSDGLIQLQVSDGVGSSQEGSGPAVAGEDAGVEDRRKA